MISGDTGDRSESNPTWRARTAGGDARAHGSAIGVPGQERTRTYTRVGLALLGAILFCSGPAFAQPHPCDTAPTVGARVTSWQPVKLRFCVKPADRIVRVDVVEDGAPAVPIEERAATALGSPNAEGYVQYEVTLGLFAAGDHTLTITAVNLDEIGAEQESDPSAPFSFRTLAPIPKPATPLITGVAQ